MHSIALVAKETREREAEEALYSFYVSSLSCYSRFQALLLLAYVTYCGRRTEAHKLRREGKSETQIARALMVSPQTVSRWLWDGPPRVPTWARRALRELSDYRAEDVAEELSIPWQAAC